MFNRSRITSLKCAPPRAWCRSVNWKEFRESLRSGKKCMVEAEVPLAAHGHVAAPKFQTQDSDALQFPCSDSNETEVMDSNHCRMTRHTRARSIQAIQFQRWQTVEEAVLQDLNLIEVHQCRASKRHVT